MNEKIISSRYAKAIYSMAEEKQHVEAILNDFKLILKTIKDSRELYNLIESPVVAGDKKLAILKEVFDDSLNDIMVSFLKLLTDKSRTYLVDSIANEYELIYNSRNNIDPVLIETAIELDEDAKNQLVEMLANWTKSTIQAEYKVNPDLKGGLKVNIKGWVFDATIKNQLEKLRKTLAG